MLSSSQRSSRHRRPALPRRALDHLGSTLPGVSVVAIGGTFGTRAIAMSLSFGAGIITARVLGPHGRAVLAVMLSVPAIFSVVGVFGLDNANARFAGRSHTAYRQLVRLSVAYSALVGSALATLWLLAGRMWPAARLGLTPHLALLTAALCPVALLTTLLGTAEIGRGRVTAYNLATAIPTGCYVAGVVVLLITGRLTVTNCFLSAAAGLTLSAIALLLLAAAKVHPDGQAVAAREYSSYAIRAYLPNVAHYGMLRMDVPIIALLSGSTAVALYAVALPVAEVLLLLPAAVALVIFPQVTSGAMGREAAGKVARTVLIATAGMAALIALAAPALMPLIYGTPYRGSVLVIWCMLPGLVLFSSSRTLQAYLAATDLLRPVITATAVGLVINLGLLLALTPRFGAAGAGAADSAGYLGFTLSLAAGVRRNRLRAPDQARPQPRTRRVHVPRLRSPRIEPSWIRTAFLGCAAAAVAIGAGLVSTSSPAIAGLCVAVTIAALCLLVPNLGLYLLAIAIPLSQSATGMMLLTPRKLMALIVVSLIGQLAARRIVRPRPAVTAVTVGLIAYLLISATVIGGIDSAGTKNWQFALLICTPLALLPLIAGPGAVIGRVLIVFGFSCAVLGLVEASHASSSLATSTDLLPADSAVLAISQTTTANHNAVGALLVIALAILLARLAVPGSGLAKIAMVAAIAALVFGIAYSFSRASYFGAIALVVVYAFRKSIRGLIGLAVATACLLPILPAAVTARFSTVFVSSNNLDIDSAVRLDLWSSALRMFDAHPLFGIGYLNFAAQLPYYFRATGNYDVAYIEFPLLEYAHNTYLTVLSQTGLVGAAAVGTLVVLAWRRAWSAARCGNWAGDAALLTIIGVGVCSIFGEVLLVPAILCGFMLVILAARAAPAQVQA